MPPRVVEIEENSTQRSTSTSARTRSSTRVPRTFGAKWRARTAGSSSASTPNAAGSVRPARWITASRRPWRWVRVVTRARMASSSVMSTVATSTLAPCSARSVRPRSRARSAGSSAASRTAGQSSRAGSARRVVRTTWPPRRAARRSPTAPRPPVTRVTPSARGRHGVGVSAGSAGRWSRVERTPSRWATKRSVPVAHISAATRAGRSSVGSRTSTARTSSDGYSWGMTRQAPKAVARSATGTSPGATARAESVTTVTGSGAPAAAPRAVASAHRLSKPRRSAWVASPAVRVSTPHRWTTAAGSPVRSSSRR